MSAADYVELSRSARADSSHASTARTAEFDALIVPTVADHRAADRRLCRGRGFLSAQRADPAQSRRSSISSTAAPITLPIARPGEAPVGLMLVGAHGGDRRLLAMARGIEAALAPHGT